MRDTKVNSINIGVLSTKSLNPSAQSSTFNPLGSSQIGNPKRSSPRITRGSIAISAFLSVFGSFGSTSLVEASFPTRESSNVAGAIVAAGVGVSADEEGSVGDVVGEALYNSKNQKLLGGQGGQALVARLENQIIESYPSFESDTFFQNIRSLATRSDALTRYFPIKPKDSVGKVLARELGGKVTYNGPSGQKEGGFKIAVIGEDNKPAPLPPFPQSYDSLVRLSDGVVEQVVVDSSHDEIGWLLIGAPAESERAFRSLMAIMHKRGDVNKLAAFLDAHRIERSGKNSGFETYYQAYDRTAGTNEGQFYYDGMREVIKREGLGTTQSDFTSLILQYRQYKELLTAVAYSILLPPDVKLPGTSARYDYDSVQHFSSFVPGQESTRTRQYSLRHQINILLELNQGDIEPVAEFVAKVLENNPVPMKFGETYNPVTPLMDAFFSEARRLRADLRGQNKQLLYPESDLKVVFDAYSAKAQARANAIRIPALAEAKKRGLKLGDF